MQLVHPNMLVTRALPDGLPLVRNEVRRRVPIFSRGSLDPDATPGDPGLFGPRSVSWRLVGQPIMAIAGLRAALLQTLSPPVPTATHSTGEFYRDFMGRVARTGAFVAAQNLGSMDEVHRSARRVRAMHRVVRGTGDDGVEFDAGDPHQQAWVSMTLTDSILVVNERFGSGRLSRRAADRFVREQSTHGALLDPRVDIDAVFCDDDTRTALQAGALELPQIESGELPVTLHGLRRRMRAWNDELRVTPLTRMLIDATIGLTEIPATQRAALRPLVLATLSTIPEPAHRLLAPHGNRWEEHLAALGLHWPLAALHLLVGTSTDLDTAQARARRRTTT